MAINVNQMQAYIRGLASNSEQIADPKDREYILSLNELLELGIGDEIDTKAGGRIEGIYRKTAGRRPMWTLEHLRNRVAELAESHKVITSEADREFILGLQMLIDMDEKLDIAAAPRVEGIYQRTLSGVGGIRE